MSTEFYFRHCDATFFVRTLNWVILAYLFVVLNIFDLVGLRTSMVLVLAVQYNIRDYLFHESVSFLVESPWTLEWTEVPSHLPAFNTHSAEMVRAHFALDRIFDELQTNVASSEMADVVFRKN